MSLLLSIGIVLAATQPVSEAELRAEIRALEARGRELDQLRPQSPERFVTGSLALADAYAAAAKRYAAFPPSRGAEHAIGPIVMRAAAAARYDLKDPRRAIGIYRRAAAELRAKTPQAALAYHEQIADIQQFDLGDRAAALATYEELRKNAPRIDPRDEYAAWLAWQAKAVEAEIAYLKSGKRFDGPIPAEIVGGMVFQLVYGSAMAAYGGALPDPALTPYAPPALSSHELEKKLAALPPSHGSFLRNWTFAAHLPPGAARAWLARNDPSGFWTASLLTLAAILDRQAAGEPHMLSNLVRSDLGRGKPTGFALLAREYAKTHRIPEAGKMQFGH